MIFEAKPAVIGHRGCGPARAGTPAAHPGSRGRGGGRESGYRENSIESFLAAAELGADWVELDARRSSDGELVVWHDPVTPAGKPVIGCTADALAVEGIVRLADVLGAVPRQVGVDIDVKTMLADATDPPEQRTHALVGRALDEVLGTRRFLVTSFDPSVLTYLARQPSLGDQVGLGLLTEVGFSAGPGVSAAANLHVDVICLHTGSIGTLVQAAGVVEAAHQAGLEVMTWTPGPALAAELTRAGVDAVCVDDVPGTRAALAALAQPGAGQP